MPEIWDSVAVLSRKRSTNDNKTMPALREKTTYTVLP